RWVLSTYVLMIGDTRLKERALELIGEGWGLAQSLGLVAREAARVANGIVGDPFLQERARDIEDLCDALLMLASPDSRAELPSKAVLLGEQLTVFDLLVSARAQPAGIAITERTMRPRTHSLLPLIPLPRLLRGGRGCAVGPPGRRAPPGGRPGFPRHHAGAARGRARAGGAPGRPPPRRRRGEGRARGAPRAARGRRRPRHARGADHRPRR